MTHPINKKIVRLLGEITSMVVLCFLLGFSCFAQTQSNPDSSLGIFIKDNLFIGEGVSVSLFSEKIEIHTSILSGEIILKNNKPQKLTVLNTTKIASLEIDNSSSVLLQGILTITNHLLLTQGKFIIPFSSKLLFDAQAVFTSEGGYLSFSEDLNVAKFPQPQLQKISPYNTFAYITIDGLKPFYPYEKTTFLTVTFSYKSVDVPFQEPPPDIYS